MTDMNQEAQNNTQEAPSFADMQETGEQWLEDIGNMPFTERLAYLREVGIIVDDGSIVIEDEGLLQLAKEMQKAKEACMSNGGASLQELLRQLGINDESQAGEEDAMRTYKKKHKEFWLRAGDIYPQVAIEEASWTFTEAPFHVSFLMYNADRSLEMRCDTALRKKFNFPARKLASLD